jgi:hypothetical protein
MDICGSVHLTYSSAGWPDWANFRPNDDSLPTLGSFSKISEIYQIFVRPIST